MTSSSSNSPATTAITEEFVVMVGKTVGLDLPTDRLAVVAQRLRELHVIAADLDGLDLNAYEPAARFDVAWPEGGEK